MAGRYSRNSKDNGDDGYQDYDDYEEYARSRDDRSSYNDRAEDDNDRRYRDNYRDDGYDDVTDDYGGNSRYNKNEDEYGSDGYENDSYDRDGGYDDDCYYDNGYDHDAYDDDYDDPKPKPSRRNNKKQQSSKKSRDRRPDTGRGNGGRKKGGKGKAILIVVELVILVAIAVFAYLTFRVEKVGKIAIDEETISENMNDNVQEETTEGTMKGYKNIALFGVDSTEGELTKNTRSDTIIIASINQDTKEIKLCSIYRDTYLNLGNDSYNKCNAAYAKGGPEQAINMINMNMDMNISNFVTVGFSGLTTAIDDLGGIDIDVDEAEMPHLNSYQLTMSEELGYKYQEVTQTGLIHLNGLQATAYCRIRYTAGDDYKRAERQREVLMTTLEKAKTADAATLSKVVDDVSEKIVTNFDITNDILPMVLDVADYKIADQNGFPQEDMRTAGNVGSKGSCVIPRDLDSNVVWLHKFLFDDDSYTVSTEVDEYSQHIASDTAGVS